LANTEEVLEENTTTFCMKENSKPVSISLASHLKLSSQLSPKTDKE
jgi:hypothetical protein